ncbi:hypothetical protein NC652_030338 [Populus alba x Populus x berolinensis]|nr:hypothetical protein NC652_030338 [Populus alba x Populus x berolinensis]
MFIVGSWNIWGLNGLHKQKTVHAWTQKHILDIFGLLETKITAVNLAAIQTNLAPSHWKYHSNIASSPTCRILVGWNTQKLHLNCLHTASQWLTCEATTYSSPHPIRITFIYGHNTPAERNTLWNYIAQESAINSHIPWLVMGDFNAILSAEDRTGGDNAWPSYQNDFSSCITQSELLQVPFTGLKYSWHNGQLGSNTIQKKLDWVFGNSCLLSTWPATNAIFQPRSISDHSGIILRLQQPNQLKHTLFKFLNIWADRSDFLDIVASSWQFPLSGNPMYQLTTKLRRLKTELRKLHYNSTSNLPDRVGQAKSAWDAAQLYLDEHPLLDEAKIAERTLATEYQQLCKAEESYYKQKSRIQWLHLGDRNTAFFHKSLLHRQVRNRIHSLQDESGNTVHDPQELGKLASNYFEHLLSAPQPPDTPNLQNNWNLILFQPQPWLEDTYMWKGHSSGTFNIASAWELLRDKRPINSLHKLLWFNGHIPRQSFILWLAGIGRLHTMDRLQTVGIIRNAICILCSLHTETHEHLFFACPTTKAIWETVNQRANIYWPCSSWQNLLQWASIAYTKKNDIQHTIARLILSASVYLLWQERNKRVFNNQF